MASTDTIALSAEDVRYIATLLTDLAPLDRRRTQVLTRLIQADGMISLVDAIDALFRGKPHEIALVSLRQFRARLARAARAAGIELVLEVDSHKRTPVAFRSCWFVGITRIEDEICQYARQMAILPAAVIPQPGLVPIETENGKPRLSVFVTFAREDRTLVSELISLLVVQLKSSEFEFAGWECNEVTPGPTWRSIVRRAMRENHFGLLMISHSLPSDQAGCGEVLTDIVAKYGIAEWRRAIPVDLRRLTQSEVCDAGNLAEQQTPLEFQGMSLVDQGHPCRATQARKQFVDELSHEILSLARMNVLTMHSDARGRPLTIDVDESAPQSSASHIYERRDALECLVDWVLSPRSQAFCVVAGERGTGRTTICRRLAQYVLDDPRDECDDRRVGWPPIYLDLDLLDERTLADAGLAKIIAEALTQGRRAPELSTVEPIDIERTLQRTHALIMVDGVDRTLERTSASTVERFIRQLCEISHAPHQIRNQEHSQKRHSRCKVLLTCCSQQVSTLDRLIRKQLAGVFSSALTADPCELRLLPRGQA